jgi:hypothetical protein
MSRRILILLLGVFVGLAAVPAAAQDKREQARSIVLEGQRKFQEGLYAEAAVDFLQAFQLDPHPVIMYNVGRAHEEQGDLIKALGYYRTAIGLNPSEAVKEELDAKIKDIEFFLRSQGVDVFDLDSAQWVPQGIVTIRADPPGAQVLFDGQLIGKSPVEEKTIPQGSYVVTVRSPGFQSQERKLEVVAGKRYTLTPELEPGSDEDPATRVSPGMLSVDARAGLTVFVDGEPIATTPAGLIELSAGEHLVSVEGEDFDTHEERITVISGKVAAVHARPREVLVVQEDTGLFDQSGWGWLIAGTGVAVVGGGAVVGVLAQGNAESYGTERGSPNRANFRSNAQSQALVADVLYTVGGALVITGMVFVLTEDAAPAEAPGAYERISLAPTIVPGGVGAQAVVSW